MTIVENSKSNEAMENYDRQRPERTSHTHTHTQNIHIYVYREVVVDYRLISFEEDLPIFHHI